MSKHLSKLDQTKRNECEKRIRDAIATGQRATYDLAAGIRDMRDGKWYLETHETLEEWLADNHGISRSRCYQLINHIETLDMMAVSTSGRHALPNLTERATRPIAALPEAKRADAIAQARLFADEKAEPLAPKHLRAAAAKFAPPSEKRSAAAVPAPVESSIVNPQSSIPPTAPDLKLAGRWSTPEELASELKPFAAEIRRLCDGRSGPVVTHLLSIARSIEAAQLRLVG